jgi:hypothetical protein
MVELLKGLFRLKLKHFGHIVHVYTAQAAIILVASVLATGCGTLRPAAQADTPQAVLESALADYEKGSLASLQSLLPASFIGRASLLDAAQRSLGDQKNIRVTLSDIKQTDMKTASATKPAPASLSARWEKRFVRIASQTPALETGTLQIILRRSPEGWRIESLPADNPFTR